MDHLNWRARVRRIAMLSCALAASLLLSSCTEGPSEPLRIASSPWPGYEPLYLAREIGYLPAAKANIYELPSSDITLESFRNRSADMATLTLDEALDLLQSGVRFRVLFVIDASNGADAVMAAPGIKKLSDLKGKRIVIENIPLGVYMLSRLLDKAGLTRKDLTIITARESRHEEMYRKGAADAFITFDPFKARLAALGAHDIFDSSDIPNEIFDLMLVHEDVYLQRHAEVCGVARQWFRTLTYMKQAPEAAEQTISKRLGVTPAAYRRMVAGIRTPALRENMELLGGKAPAILGPAQKLGAVMLHEGQYKKVSDFSSALDTRLGSCAFE